MEKDFDSWNKLKKIIDKKSDNLGVNEREIWWMSLGLNIGIEIDGKNNQYERTALVLRKFNKQMTWVLPITSKMKSDKFHYKFIFDKNEYFVVLTQIRTVSTKRFVRKVGTISNDDFKSIIRGVLEFFPQ